MLEKLIRKEHLTHDEAEYLMEGIINDVYSPMKVGALLIALLMKGETADELTAFAKVLRRFCPGVTIQGNEPLLDTCGTGGDGCGTFNISTAVALIAASCGVKVTKHGNRASSSKCGSADVLEALGMNISLPRESLVECITKTNFCFLYAREHHHAMSKVAPVRKELGVRTTFNLLGPLANPAKATHQLIGLFSLRHLEMVAQAASRLGVKRALIVHGDGLDELSTTGTSHYAELRDGVIQRHAMEPGDFGLKTARKEDLKGGEADQNAMIIREIFSGKKGPKRDITVLNTGAALYIAGHSPSIAEGMSAAALSIDNGEAIKTLDRIVEFTKSAGKR